MWVSLLCLLLLSDIVVLFGWFVLLIVVFYRFLSFFFVGLFNVSICICLLLFGVWFKFVCDSWVLCDVVFSILLVASHLYSSSQGVILSVLLLVCWFFCFCVLLKCVFYVVVEDACMDLAVSCSVMYVVIFWFLMTRRPPRATLLPYSTLSLYIWWRSQGYTVISYAACWCCCLG